MEHSWFYWAMRRQWYWTTDRPSNKKAHGIVINSNMSKTVQQICRTTKNCCTTIWRQNLLYNKTLSNKDCPTKLLCNKTQLYNKNCPTKLDPNLLYNTKTVNKQQKLSNRICWTVFPVCNNKHCPTNLKLSNKSGVKTIQQPTKTVQQIEDLSNKYETVQQI